MSKANLLIGALEDAKHFIWNTQGAVYWYDHETLVTANQMIAKIDLAIAKYRAAEQGVTE